MTNPNALPDYPIITTHLPTVAEVDAVAEAARRTAVAAAEAERQANWKMWEKRRRVADYAFWRPVLTAVCAAKPPQSTDAWVLTDNGEDECRLTIAGVDATRLLQVREDETHQSRYRSVPNGRKSLLVGQVGERTRFPQKADDSWSYGKIALRLWADCSYIAGKLAAEQRLKDNVAAVAQFRLDNGLREYGCAGPSTDPEKPVRLRYSLDCVMTTRQAASVIAALRAAGLRVD